MSRSARTKTSKSVRKKPAVDMPPAISDDESGSEGPDMIPAKGSLPGKEDGMDVDAGEEDEQEDEEDGEEEYRVEKIVKHGFAEDGSLVYLIKWLGYEKNVDRTWEPTENLANAKEILEAYHQKIGGVPTTEQKPQKKSAKNAKGAKRPASAAFPDLPAVESSGKKGRKTTGTTNGEKWIPPDGLWEKHIARVSSIIEETDEEAKATKGKATKGLFGLLEWNDGHKTQFPLDTVRLKCPQKLLDYYEQHLVFRSGDSADADEE